MGAALVKSGAVSGITHGIIDGIEGVYQLDYSNFGYGSLWMQGFRVIRGSVTSTRTVSEAGDSGAIWVDEETCTAVGLHFAGEDGGSPLKEYALAHSIEAVLERLGVVLEVKN